MKKSIYMQFIMGFLLAVILTGCGGSGGGNSNDGPKAPIITTIAGTGTAGYSGDGGDATAAQLNWPGCVAVDADGNIYIADINNYCIRKIDPHGTITTYAGTGTFGQSGDGAAANATQLTRPMGLAVDASRNVYIADGDYHRIRKVDSKSKIITTIAGNGTKGYSGDGNLAINGTLNYPEFVTVDTGGNIYITDSSNHCIRKVDSNGKITTFAGTGTAGYSGDGEPLLPLS